MHRIRKALCGLLVPAIVAGLLVASAPSASAGVLDPVDQAITWLEAQQEEDGGFELADFPGFETPDAVLAIAAAGQTTEEWSPSEAKAAVEAVTFEDTDVTALDWLDAFSRNALPGQGGFSPGQAAKLIVLNALPLGDDPTEYDPKGDGSAVDLTAGLGDIPAGIFNQFLFGRIAEGLLPVNVHQDDLQSICEAQAPDGGWSFDGLPTDDVASDVDSTGYAAMALAHSGVPTTDPSLVGAEAFLRAAQVADGDPTWPDDAGAWRASDFPGSPPGEPDPNATTLGIFGLRTLGVDIETLADDPVAWLLDQQVQPPDEDPAGRFAGPNDGFGVNTFATSQAIQALLADLLPFLEPVDTGRECLPADSFTDTGAGTWFENAARWAERFAIANGFPDGDFKGNRSFTRAQAATWFHAVFGNVEGAPDSGFTDVKPWFEDAANFLADPGWGGGQMATGYPDGTFRGDELIERAQAVVWLYRLAGSPELGGIPDVTFTDVKANAWFRDALRWAVHHGIVQGYPDDTFRETEHITRAQGVSWLYALAADPDAWDFGDVAEPPTTVFSVYP